MAADVQCETTALGDAARYRLFGDIADAPGPAGAAELTAHVRLNHRSVPCGTH